MIARFLITLGFVLAMSVPGFARMAPMAMGQAASAICAGHNCSDQQPGKSAKHHMTAACLAMACTGPVALSAHAMTVTPMLHEATPYELPVSSLRTGLRPMPDGPPPRSLSRS